jgi:DNA-binding FadR family transcriptional regulator
MPSTVTSMTSPGCIQTGGVRANPTPPGVPVAITSPLLAALYQAIEAARHGQVWGDLKRRSASPEHREQYQWDHRAIVAALRTRDSGRAVEAMRLHLARVSDHLNATDPAASVTWR